MALLANSKKIGEGRVERKIFGAHSAGTVGSPTCVLHSSVLKTGREINMKILPIGIAALGLATFAAPLASAQGATDLPGEEAADVRIQPEAVGALDRMAANLRALKSFTLIADTTQDDVLDDGQKLEIAGRTTYRVRRPDRMTIDVINDKRNRTYYYDGKTVTQFSPALGYYSIFPAADTIAKTLDIAHEKHDIQLPLSDLFYWGTERSNVKEVESAYFVGEIAVGGIVCNLYAYRAEAVDFQVAVRKQGDPLPCKLVVTDRTLEARPKYSATLGWDVGSEFADATFTFVPPAGAEQIDIEEIEQSAN